MKVRHDVEEERERVSKEEEERNKKKQEEEERRARDKKEREDFQKQLRESMNTKFDVLCEALFWKKKEGSDEIEKLKSPIDKLEKLQLGFMSVMNGCASVDVAARRLREQDEEKRKTRDESERRIAILEEEVVLLRRLNGQKTNEAATWKQEALRPSNKRGAVVVEETPNQHARVRPRCTTLKTPGSHAVSMAKVHAKEVAALTELRSRDLNGRRKAEQEVQRLKEGQKRLRMEKEQDQPRTSGTNLTRNLKRWQTRQLGR
ncbi:hypothetical protein CBR_g19471 [Chara braunii]|uniref:Uncharacterized protein n=1 Tax=Chara braunii TaxID=69332 RepID=A0A388KY15_CHABU|nr:hypothetical protein CBR_g19471 [Chara braunii]|eukprot:GBG74956.1 hypothetical protein CBR_g19471 [Chara braunii]